MLKWVDHRGGERKPTTGMLKWVDRFVKSIKEPTKRVLANGLSNRRLYNAPKSTLLSSNY
eukprot:902676-Prorocentrum_minimum.AAC.1